MPRRRSSPLAQEIGKRGAFDSPEQEAYLNLVRTHAALSSDFARLFKAHGVSEPQYNVLRILAGSRAGDQSGGAGSAGGGGGGGGGRTMEGIGADMVARDPDVTRLVDRLERAGLVERRRSEEDRRVVVVRITPKGRGLLRRLRGPVLELHRAQLGSMGEPRLRELCDLLVAARRAGEPAGPGDTR